MTIASPLATDELATMLRAGVRGDVVTPDDASFPAAAFGLDLSAAHRPDLVVIAANSGDAAATVRLAARAGRRVVVQATGHRPAQAGPGTVLIVTRLLAQVRIDPEAKTAIVGAGASWRQVLEAAETYGLAPISSSADREPLARTFAFAVDHIRELEVVTARGDVLTVDAHRDMFHALRRGRAPFGLVTAATIDLVPLARLYAGGLWFPAEAAAVVLPRWHDLAAGLPATARTSLTRVRLSPELGSPASNDGRSVLHVRFAHVGDPAVGAQLIADMRDAWTQLLDTVKERSYASLPTVTPGAAWRMTERHAVMNELTRPRSIRSQTPPAKITSCGPNR